MISFSFQQNTCVCLFANSTKKLLPRQNRATTHERAPR